MREIVDASEISWLEWSFKGLITVIIALFWWMWGKLVNAVSKANDRILEVEKLVTAHELEDARNFVSKQDFKETVLEMKDTVKRVHEKMDQISQTLVLLNKRQ